jgi:heme exporter protein B
MNVIAAIMKRDARLAIRQGGGLAPALGFILTVLVLTPLALGPDQALLQRLAPGMMWLALLLSVLLTAERIFAQDLEDGSLETLVLTGQPLELVALAKAAAHWLTVSLPLAVVSPVLALMLNVETAGLPILLAAMLLGSLALSMLAAIGSAITAGLRRGGLLISLLVLPLYIPVMIFGISASSSAMSPGGPSSPLLILFALSLMATVISPWAAAAALRIYLR